MKGASSCTFRGNKFSLIFIVLICTSLAFWAWEKAPLMGPLIPSSDQFDMHLGLFSPVVPAKNLDTNSSEHTNQQPSESTGEKAKSDSSKEEHQLDSSKKKAPSNYPNQEDLSGKATVDVVRDVEKPVDKVPNDNVQEPGIPLLGFSERNSSIELKVANTSETAPPDKKECNYAKGKWVADEKRPLYSGFECKQWLSEMWACRWTNRPDFSFENYRWQPANCEMPEFEGSKFLKRMQDKTIAFVGDSLGRQQFQSLMCMVTGGRYSPEVEDIGKEYGLAKARGAIRPDGWVYRFPQTNTTILYYWSASLCKLEPINQTDPNTDIAMHLDQPATFITQYLDKFDVLILNTGHHWNGGKLKANRWKMHVNGAPIPNKTFVDIWAARNFTVYKVAKWLDTHLPEYPRLKIFFRTMSPRHFVNGDWNTGGSCDNANPLAGGSEVTQENSNDPVIEGAVRGTKIKLLDITAFSQLRDESHISKYRVKEKQAAYDCLHWCLPGIPDSWNEVMAAQV